MLVDRTAASAVLSIGTKLLQNSELSLDAKCR
jgi:hypothetical protein